MTVTDTQLKQVTVPLSEMQKPAERSSVTPYTVYNDTDRHVSVFLQEGEAGNPVSIITLAPGETSSSYDRGTYAAIMDVGSGQQQQILWWPDDRSEFTYWFTWSGGVAGGRRNRVSDFIG
ncbi:hypothetical protein APR12_004163 [Nocardia amikacinitolerans]|uniref:hypothetical protein n=1 Tax=Nocardia amikacinitolerans TaxID=756689 RepID=UPI00083155B5|nr:hypothetical protein [Nocardia amikacinitolerans]MCP2318804.1 hypothetical protein [Nocardia amikacinitolerans]